jgi:Mg-chelatase subunit ChlD
MDTQVKRDPAALAAVLSEYNFCVCIDTSGSMGEPAKAGDFSRTRWDAVQESCASFARDVEKIDTDGIDVVTFGGTGVESFKGVTAAKVSEIFATKAPRGSTPLAQGLAEALRVTGKDKKRFILVFTDGVPDSEIAAEQVIVGQANSQATDEECTFLFVQVGDDAAASKYLSRLDDGLTGKAKFDIVDAKTIDQANAFATTAELVAHAITD